VVSSHRPATSNSLISASSAASFFIRFVSPPDAANIRRVASACRTESLVRAVIQRRTSRLAIGVADNASSSLVVTVPGRGLTLILLANSQGLVRPYPLAQGDVTASPFARIFLSLFVR
jgi:hypothetical protein